MVTTSELRLRLNRKQRQILQNKVSASGFGNMSSFARNSLFGEEMSIHVKLDSLLKIVREIEKKLKRRKQKE
jgi:hypothetical protein